MLKNFKENILAEIIQNIVFNFFNNFFSKKYLSFTLNNNFTNLDNIYSFYNKNKKILLNKSEAFFRFLDKNMNNVKFDLSFLENIDIDKFIKKFEQLCSNGYISLTSNDDRKKVIEKFKKIIDGISLLYTIFTEIPLNYSSFSSNIWIVRAPPEK